MVRLEWEPTPDGYESPGFRIRKLTGTRPLWRLETSDGVIRHGSSTPVCSVHPTAVAAQRRACRDANEYLRLARVKGHLAVAALATLLFAVLIGTARSLEVFAAAMFFLYAALRSFEDAAVVGWAEAWGWTRDPGVPSWSCRLVQAAAARLRVRRLASDTRTESPAIIMLPPDPDPGGGRPPSGPRATIRG